MFNKYALIMASLILFIISYNVYIYRSTRTPIVLPLWLFPLAWLLSSITYLFIGEDYALLLYYFTCILALGIISKPSIVEKTVSSMKKYYVYIFLGIALLAMIYSPEYELWVSLGSFIEYFLASYLYIEYSNTLVHRETTILRKRTPLVPAGLLFSLLSSLIVFIKPWMIVYGFIVNSLKVFSINTKNPVPVILIIDVFARFLLVGGVQWIIDML